MPTPSPKSSTQDPAAGVPFHTTEEAWFWFIAARTAQIDGAKRTSRPGAVSRPCEPVDILNIITRLHRSRLLKIEHFRVLKYYGERHMRPDPDRPGERASSELWDQAIDRLNDIFIRRGIVTPPPAWWREQEKPPTLKPTRRAYKKRVTRRDQAEGLWKKLSTGMVRHAA